MPYAYLNSYKLARQKEILADITLMSIPRSLENAIYGRMPVEAPDTHVEILEEGEAEQGAWRRQLRITLARAGQSTGFTVLAYAPSKAGVFPLVLSPNLNGNHSVITDEKVIRSPLSSPLARIGVPKIPNERGTFANRFPIALLLAQGYATATFHHDEAEPDRAGETRWGVRLLYPGHDWGALSAWAWCLSRVVDSTEHLPAVDASRVHMYGFSRGGKSALLAAASDTRFASVIAEGSGKVGAALSSSKRGEPLFLMGRMFPHWFGRGFDAFAKHPESCPEDQDALLRTTAPRRVLITAGVDDAWTDPQGQKEAVTRVNSEAVQFFLRKGPHEPQISSWGKYVGFFG